MRPMGEFTGLATTGRCLASAIHNMTSEGLTMKKMGAVSTGKTVKAGCGIRYDPDTLGENTGFDFAGASDLTGIEDGNPANNIDPTSCAVDDKSKTLNRAVPNHGDGGN